MLLCVTLVYEQLFNAVRLSLLSLGPECCLCLGPNSSGSQYWQWQWAKSAAAELSLPCLPLLCRSFICVYPFAFNCGSVLLLQDPPATAAALCVITSVCCVNNSVSCLGRVTSLTHRLHAQLMPCIRTSSIVPIPPFRRLCVYLCVRVCFCLCLWHAKLITRIKQRNARSAGIDTGVLAARRNVFSLDNSHTARQPCAAPWTRT